MQRRGTWRLLKWPGLTKKFSRTARWEPDGGLGSRSCKSGVWTVVVWACLAMGVAQSCVQQCDSGLCRLTRAWCTRGGAARARSQHLGEKIMPTWCMKVCSAPLRSKDNADYPVLSQIMSSLLILRSRKCLLRKPNKNSIMTSSLDRLKKIVMIGKRKHAYKIVLHLSYTLLLKPLWQFLF